MNKNSMPFGLILGIIIPIVAFGLLYGLEAASGKDFKEQTIVLLAICFNLIPFNIFNKKKHIQSMRGVILPTIIFAFAWALHYVLKLF